MSIGSIIKQLRREKDITQEQLAEYLGITSRAISQWECNRTTPDISQIPVICHFFDISSDFLLGINTEKRNAEVHNYLTESDVLMNQGKYEECTALLRLAHKKYPQDYMLTQKLANALVCEYSRKGISNYDEVFDLCQRVLTGCTENIIRYEAISTLGTAYAYADMREEMINIAKEMPRINFSYENFMTYRWKGDSGHEEFQNYLSFLIYHTIEMIGLDAIQKHDNGEYIYPLDTRIKLWKTAINLLELIFPDGDYQIYAQLGESACSHLCNAYLKKQDYEEAWVWIQNGSNFAIHMDTYDFNEKHKSPVLRDYSSGGWIIESGVNHSQAMLYWLKNDKDTVAIRSDMRYKRLVERLSKVVRPH